MSKAKEIYEQGCIDSPVCTADEYIIELQEQVIKLTEALKTSTEIMKEFSDKGKSNIAVQARKNKKLLRSLNR